MTIISNQPVLELTDKTLTLFPNSRSLIGWKMITSLRYRWLRLSNTKNFWGYISKNIDSNFHFISSISEKIMAQEASREVVF